MPRLCLPATNAIVGFRRGLRKEQIANRRRCCSLLSYHDLRVETKDGRQVFPAGHAYLDRASSQLILGSAGAMDCRTSRRGKGSTMTATSFSFAMIRIPAVSSFTQGTIRSAAGCRKGLSVPPRSSHGSASGAISYVLGAAWMVGCGSEKKKARLQWRAPNSVRISN